MGGGLHARRVRRSRETVKRSDLAGGAQYGYCASHSRYFWGLRLHLVCTRHGLPIAFALTGAKADERETLLDLLAVEPRLTAEHPGQTLIGDKNYFGREFEQRLADLDIRARLAGQAQRPTSGTSGTSSASSQRSRRAPSRVITSGSRRALASSDMPW